MGKMKTKQSDLDGHCEQAITGDIKCTSFLDSTGRIYVPLRIRNRAGLERGVTYEIGISGKVISDFKVMANE